MAFSLLPDYTYQIGPVPEKENKVNGPTRQMLDMLKEMRRTRAPWTVQDFVDHDLLGGIHKKRAIKYSLDKLEGQKLIERCATPASWAGKGRPPAFYEAVGTDVPGAFSSRARENRLLVRTLPPQGIRFLTRIIRDIRVPNRARMTGICGTDP
jgi:hypothetical protein